MKRLGILPFLLVPILAPLTCCPTASGETDVAKLKAIVVPANADEYEQRAARTLRAYLGRIYGVNLPIREADGKAGKRVILVGAPAVKAGRIRRKELDKLRPDGFVLRAKEGVIALAGPRSSGTLYASLALLERAGYRFYAADCEVVPKAASSVLEDFEKTDAPFFDYRTSNDWRLGASIREEFLGNPRQAQNPDIFGKGSTIWWQHNAGYLVPLDLYHDEHPEYFALRTDGKRLPKDTRDSYVHLCMSNPDVRGISRERLLKWISMQPDRRVFWIHPGDGTQWCQCEECKATDVEPGNYSDRLLSYANELASAVREKHPGKRLAIAAYCGTELAPARLKPAENLLVFYCPYYGIARSNLHPLTHETNRVALGQLQAWMEAAPGQVYLYDYNHSIGTKYFPSWDAAAEKIKWAAQQGVRGEYLCGSPTHMRDLFKYMTGKLLWNPRLDPEAMKREFVQAYFGPAAPRVMEYLTLVKNRLKEGHPRGMHDRHMPASFYAGGFKDRLVTALDKALRAAAGNERAAGEIAREKQTLLADHERATAPEKPREPAPAEKIDGGLLLRGDSFAGGRLLKNFGWMCPKRAAVTFLYSPRTPMPSKAEASFTLDKASGKAKLRIEGQGGDKDLPPSTPIRVTLNGREVYAGPCTFRCRGWSWLEIDVPDGLLRKGRNTLRIANTSDRLRMDHWWAGICEVRVLLD